MIDWMRAAELYEDFGEEQFVEILEAFVLDIKTGREQLVAAVVPEEQRAAFHFLKGAALNIGLSEVAKNCALGERAVANAGNVAEIKAEVLNCADRDCMVLLREWRARLGVG